MRPHAPGPVGRFRPLPVALFLVCFIPLVSQSPASAGGRPGGLRLDRPGRGTLEPPVQGDSLGGRPLSAVDLRSGGPLSLRANHILASGAVDQDWLTDSAAVTAPLGHLQRSCSDGRGGTLTVWTDERDGQPNVRLGRTPADTAGSELWPSDGVVICTGPASRYQPDLASDGAGGAYVVWKDCRGDGDIYAQHIDAQGQVAPGWTADGLALCDAPGEQANPRIAAASGGSAFVVWEDHRGGYPAVYVLHLGDQGPAAGWSAGGVQLGEAGVPASSPQVFSNALAQVVATWQSQPNPESFELLARSLGDELAGGTSGPALTLSSGASGFGEVGAAAGPGNDLVVAWSERRGEESTLHCQRLSGSGALQALWPTGIGLRDRAVVATAPAIMLSSDTTVALAWQAFASDGASDVFLQLLTVDGALAAGWPAGGVAAVVARGDQYAPALSSDGQGGLVVSCIDARATAEDVSAAQMARQAGFARLVSAVAVPGHARLTWQLLPGTSQVLAARRRIGDGEWTDLPVPVADADGKVTVDDRTVADGDHVDYRLSVKTATAELFLDPVSLIIPLAPKVLTLHRVRALGRDHALLVSFALPRGEAPRLDLLDVQGRRMQQDRLDGLDPGEQQYRWTMSARMSSGVYFLRLLQGREERVAKVIYIR